MFRFLFRLSLATALVMPACLTPALANDAVQRGQALAEANCGRCHAIDRTSDSPIREAPPFRNLHQRYAVETLGEALAEGIYTGHAEMPAFELTPDQIHDFLVFLKTLE
ncbi:MAG: cytochrome c [Alphaproteobacteria bacterium]|nr:cytochrome c [Alphaproteobacteria bacterium]